MSDRWQLETATVERLYHASRGAQWPLAIERFAAALERSARRFFGDETPDRAALSRYLDSLHVADLACACACADGSDAAWDHFIREYRPVLYRSADALDASGGARELADSLYGELFGLALRDGVRRSHFDYYHGRSSLGTWLRAVLSQRFVDRVRGARRTEPLPDDDAPQAMAAPAGGDVRGAGWAQSLELVRAALIAAVAALAPRDRLRLSCYYAQSMTLAQIGRLLDEHEATVSRHLTKTRKTLRQGVEAHLRERQHMSDAAIGECLSAAAADTGTLDLAELLGADGPLGRDEPRKETAPERSKG